MTRIEIAIQRIDWTIEDAEKAVEENRQRIKELVNDDTMMKYDADSVLAYAQRMADAAKKLRDLSEQRHMLEWLAEGERQ